MNRKPIESLPPQKVVDAETGEEFKAGEVIRPRPYVTKSRPLIQRLAPILEAIGKEPCSYRCQIPGENSLWCNASFQVMVEVAERGDAVRIVPDVPTMTIKVPVPDRISEQAGVVGFEYGNDSDAADAVNAVMKVFRQARAND